MKQETIVHVINTADINDDISDPISIFMTYGSNEFTPEFVKNILLNEKTLHYSLEVFQHAFNRSDIDSNTQYILCEVKDVEEEIVQPDSLNYVTVPIVELASNLAHNSTRDELVGKNLAFPFDESLWELDDPFGPEDGNEHYEPEAQEVYDRWYNYYYNEIQNTTKKF